MGVPDRLRGQTQVLVLALGLNLALILSWSAGFVGVRFALDHAPIFLILFWRSLVSGLLLLPFTLFMGPPMPRKAVQQQVAFGAFAMAGYLGGYTLAIAQGAPTGIVALITDMLPLAVALLSWPILGQTLNLRQCLGTLVAVTGVVIASGVSFEGGGASLWAYSGPVLGTIGLALATLLQQRSNNVNLLPYQSVCIQCLSAAAVFSVFAWNEGSLVPLLNGPFIGAIFWLVVVATYGAWGLYYLALRHSNPTRVTAILYLSPPVTMLWAWAVFAEPLSWAMLTGLLTSLVGIWLVVR